MFKHKGIESDKEIMEMIFGDLEDGFTRELIDELVPSIIQGSIIYKQISAIKYMVQYTQGGTISEVINTINNELVPHIGTDFTNKAYFLAHMVNKLILNKKE